MATHIPVLLNECIEGLAIKEGGIYVDATIGGAGHSYHIINRLNKTGHLYGFDQDESALETSRARLQTLSLSNYTLIHSNFLYVKEGLGKLGVTKIDGILLDLGVSSFQFDIPERGFSYRFDSRLDMRMDTSKEFTAFDIVNTYKEEDIVNILYKYGEEQYAKSIAKHIVSARKIKPIETTFELVDIIKESVPGKYKQMTHPAKKTFQALRIETNHELDILEESLEKALSMLNKGGRMCVISFHSLEDRIVKEVFNRHTKQINPNRFMPSVEQKPLEYKLITRKPIMASEKELETNNRAHSAKLRIIEKL